MLSPTSVTGSHIITLGLITGFDFGHAVPLNSMSTFSCFCNCILQPIAGSAGQHTADILGHADKEAAAVVLREPAGQMSHLHSWLDCELPAGWLDDDPTTQGTCWCLVAMVCCQHIDGLWQSTLCLQVVPSDCATSLPTTQLLSSVRHKLECQQTIVWQSNAASTRCRDIPGELVICMTQLFAHCPWSAGAPRRQLCVERLHKRASPACHWLTCCGCPSLLGQPGPVWPQRYGWSRAIADSWTPPLLV